MSKKLLKYSSLRGRQNVYGYILVGFSFLVLTFLTVKTLAPEIKTGAATQTASQTVGPYTMSMSNDSVATINITPTDTQTVYTGTNNLSVTNTCTAGATITMTTNSTTSNSLTRAAVNSDTLKKDIVATTTAGLDNHSWGYALNDSSTYSAVPKKGTTAATIYNASAAQTSALSVPVKFGVKTNNELPSGTYTNDVIYTMTPKAGCLTYAVTWDFDGGTAKSGATYPTSLSWGATVNLSTLTPTRDGYTFAGWTNGSSNYTGTETAANLNSSNAKSVTVKAKWNLIQTVWDFDYTGNVQTFTVPQDGYYKLEVWGAQGSNNDSNGNAGGYGGYSFGNYLATQGKAIYVIVGQNGQKLHQLSSCAYNGGGCGSGVKYTWGGGGATHISTYNCGQLKNCSSYKSNILIVAGGGGGASIENGRSGDWGGAGGGYIGANGAYFSTLNQRGGGGTQTTGGVGGTNAGASPCINGTDGAFGYGGTGNGSCGSNGHGTGGGGWYGGGGSANGVGGGGAGGGSGYIGNSSLVSNKGMYMYHATANNQTGCSSSNETETRTTCTTNYSSTATSNYAKTGNGYARITYLGTSI